MAGIKMSGKLVGLLGAATEGFCDWLCDALPKQDQAWWSSLVLSNLSCQQRERVERHRRRSRLKAGWPGWVAMQSE